MEDALVLDTSQSLADTIINVLILVVMEDALVQVHQRHH